MEAQQEAVEIAQKPVAAFSSMGIRNLNVAISPRDIACEMPLERDATIEEFALFEFEDGRAIGLKNVSFKPNGYYEAFDERVATALRKHPANSCNGTEEVAFEEISRKTLEDIDLLNKAIATKPAEGLNDSDRELLRNLTKWANVKQLAPPLVTKAIAAFPEACTRFGVTGAKAPVVGQRNGIVQTRLLDLLEILAEAGITLEAVETSDDGRGNT